MRRLSTAPRLTKAQMNQIRAAVRAVERLVDAYAASHPSAKADKLAVRARCAVDNVRRLLPALELGTAPESANGAIRRATRRSPA